MKTLMPARLTRAMETWPGRDPLRAFHEEIDELMNRFFSDWEAPARTFAPSLDVCETDKALLIRLDLPGVRPEEITVEVSDQTVRITGERKAEKEEGITYLRTERPAGAFARSVALPCGVKQDKIEAEEHDGVLTITLPKAEEAMTRKIEVKAS